PPPLPRRFQCGDHQGHHRAGVADGAGSDAGGYPRDRYRRPAGAVRAETPAQLQPYPGHPEHDRADPRDGRAAGRMTAKTPIDVDQLRQVMGGYGHGQSIGLVYRDHGDDWAEFGLPYDERLIGQPATG